VAALLGQALYAAATAAWNTWARDRALRDAPGFAEAWEITNNIPGWLSEVNAAVFWGVIAEVRPKSVVEIGSYLGKSTTLLALGVRHLSRAGATVSAIDPHTGDRQHLEALNVATLPSLELFRQHIEGAGVGDVVEEHVATSDEVAQTWTKTIDLLYIDGWHSYDAVRRDAANFASKLSPNGVVCFDDYAYYDEVRQAADDACAELGLISYGATTMQAWAGRSERPPQSVARVRQLSSLIHAVRDRSAWIRSK